MYVYIVISLYMWKNLLNYLSNLEWIKCPMYFTLINLIVSNSDQHYILYDIITWNLS